jgi:hypothetical protein
MSRMLFKSLIVLLLFILGIEGLNAQSIQGSPSAVSNVYYIYSYDEGNSISNPKWVVSNNGNIETASDAGWNEGTTYYISVRWTTPGTGSLKLYCCNSDLMGTKSITITACSASAPTITSPLYKCGGGNIALTASPGSGGSTVNWYSGNAYNSGLLSTGTSFSGTSGVTYYITTYNPSTSCESYPRTAVVTQVRTAVDINDLGTGNTQVCGSGQVTLTASVVTTNEHVIWYSQNTSGSYSTSGYLHEGTSFDIGTVSSSVIYYAGLFDAGTQCETPPGTRNAVSVAVNPIPGLPTGKDGGVCVQGSVSLSGTPGSNANTLRWYAQASGGNILATSTSYNPSISVPTNFYIASFNSTTGCESANRVVVHGNINPIPSLPTPIDGYGCKDTGGSTVDVELNGIPGNGADNLKWYTRTNNEDSYKQTSTFLLAHSLSLQATYYISSFNSATLCESDKVSVIAHVNNKPGGPSSPAVVPSCGSGQVTLSATPAGTAGSTIWWYPESGLGSALMKDVYFKPNLTVTTKFIAKTYDPSTQCLSAGSLLVTGTVNTPPVITASGNGQTICSAENAVITLTSTVEETTYAFSGDHDNVTPAIAHTSGIVDPNFTNLSLSTDGVSTGTSYYMFWGIANECQGAPVNVIVHVNPVPSVNALNNSPVICSGQSTNISLSTSVSGATYSWSPGQTNTSGATAVSNTTSNSITQVLITNGTQGIAEYYITSAFTANGKTCVSSASEVSVDVKPTPQLTVSPAYTIFEGDPTDISFTSDIPGTSFSYNISAQSNIGNAFPGMISPINQSLALTDPSTYGSLTYVINASLNGCAGIAKMSTVSLYPVPVISSNKSRVYAGIQATLFVPSFYDSYSWQSNVGLQGTGTSIVSARTGTFKVTVSKNGVSKESLPFYLPDQLSGQNQNYIATNRLQIALSDTSVVAALPVEYLSEVVQYFDGIGRSIQTVSTAASPFPAKNDIIQPVVYDEFGRETKKYLPFTTHGDGLFNDAIIDENGNYSGMALNYYNNGTTDKIIDDGRYFSETIYEPSALNRPLKNYSPGSDWYNKNKFISSDYLVNIHGTGAGHEKIIAFYINSDGVLALRPSLTGYIETGGFFSNGQLSITVTKDENGNAVREYTDKNGRIILKKVQSGSSTEFASTYYIYDDFGNLAVVLPPEGVEKIKSIYNLN